MNNRLIVALDTTNLREAERLVVRLRDAVKIFKIGSGLFTACGPESVKMVHRQGCKVFLDLKFHDIPNTLSLAAGSATNMCVEMFNVHASSGRAALEAVVSSARAEAVKCGKKPLVLGVTVLTSIEDADLKMLGILKSAQEQVLYLARLCKDAGCDGVVCSAKEISMIRKTLGKDFVIVTPGIRPQGVQAKDQKRIATPKEAIAAGADYIVVGRPITEAPDPVKAVKDILAEIG